MKDEFFQTCVCERILFVSVTSSKHGRRLPQLWEKFTLTEDEDLELEIPGGKFQELAVRGQACIVGKLITDRLLTHG
jgi:hypothetical protein